MIRRLTSHRRAPKCGKTTSVVIFVHGYGADGKDLLGLADPLAPHLPNTLFLAPDAPEPCGGNPFGYQWFPIPWLDGSSETDAAAGLKAASADLDAFIDAELAAAGLTDADLALVGFSQGTMISLHIAPRRGQAMAGVVGFSGRLLAPEALMTDSRVKPPILLLHGDADPVVPFADMDKAGQALIAAGFETFGHVMQGTGHGIAPDGLSVALSFLKERLPA